MSSSQDKKSRTIMEIDHLTFIKFHLWCIYIVLVLIFFRSGYPFEYEPIKYTILQGFGLLGLFGFTFGYVQEGISTFRNKRGDKWEKLIEAPFLSFIWGLISGVHCMAFPWTPFVIVFNSFGIDDYNFAISDCFVNWDSY